MTILKPLFLLGCFINLPLSSCTHLPNLPHGYTSQIPTTGPQKFTIKTSLIPITPTLVVGQHRQNYSYLLSPSDHLSVKVWEHPEFDFQKGVINKQGNITLPLLNEVHVAGKTIETLQTELKSRLKQYVPNPQILVTVTSYQGQKVTVLGEVTSPGKLTITDQPLTIADALIHSGGINYQTTNPRFVYVIRGTPTRHKVYWLDIKALEQISLANQFYLQSNDILYVSSTSWPRFKHTLFNS